MDNIKARIESGTKPAPCPLAHSRAIRHDGAPTQGEQQRQREEEKREQGHQTGWDEPQRQDRLRESYVGHLPFSNFGSIRPGRSYLGHQSRDIIWSRRSLGLPTQNST
jgi:hypothetical protein